MRCRVIASSRAEHPNGEVAGQPNRPGVHTAGGGSATAAQCHGVHDRAGTTGGGTTRRVDHRHSAGGDGDFNGPRTAGAGCPVGTRATTCRPAVTSMVADSPLAMFADTTRSSTRTSAGTRVAVAATRIRAPPALIGRVGVGNEVTTDVPRTAAGRWRTTSREEPGLSQTVARTTLPPGPTKANTCRPAGSRTGPMTSPVRHPVKFAPVDPHFDRPARNSLHQGDGAGDRAAGRVVRETSRGTGQADLGNREEQRSRGEAGQDVCIVHDPRVGGEASPLQRPSEHSGYVRVSAQARLPDFESGGRFVLRQFPPRRVGSAEASRLPDVRHGVRGRNRTGTRTRRTGRGAAALMDFPPQGRRRINNPHSPDVPPSRTWARRYERAPFRWHAEGQGFESPQLHPSLQHTGSPAPAAAVHLRGRRSR